MRSLVTEFHLVSSELATGGEQYYSAPVWTTPDASTPVHNWDWTADPLVSYTKGAHTLSCV